MRAVVTTLVLAVLAAPGLGGAQTVTPKLESTTQGNTTNTQVVGPGSWGEIIDRLRQRFNDPSRTRVPPLSAAERDALPSPLLWEYGFRRLNAGEADGYGLVMLAKLRMYWDSQQCRDSSANQAFAAISMGFPQIDPSLLSTNGARHGAVLDALIDDGSVFKGGSAWWACSSGMDAVDAAMNNKTLTEADWRRSPSERAELRKSFEQQIREAAAKARAQSPG